MKINSNIKETMEAQYYQPGEDIDGVLWRISNYVASAEAKYGAGEDKIKALAKEYHDTMSDCLWLPSSPFLMNAGTKVNMLSACFVQPIEDDMSGIFDTLKRAAIIHKMGGGTGFDFSPLRYEGATVGSTGGTASGPLSFLKIFDAESAVVKQGGKRRAANIACLAVNHPDILKFIDAKIDKSKLTNFNLSVAITDDFMRTLEVANDEFYTYDSNNTPINKLHAKEVFHRIVVNNWESGEPGVLFVDKINESNPILNLGRISATNPCGEIPLLPNEACNLASINLDRFVDKDGALEVDKLEYVAKLIMRFMDSAIDVNDYPFLEIKEAVLRSRKTGIGITGLHGALIRMGLQYNSEEGIRMSGHIMSLISSCLELESCSLASSKGIPDGWFGSSYDPNKKIRNLTRTCIAPTGTISMIMDTPSSGIEPIFYVAYERVTRDRTYKWVNPLFIEIGTKEGWYSESLLAKIINNGGSVQGLSEVPEKYRKLFMTGTEMSADDHIKMQAELQKFVDNSISKTINVPEEATIEDLENIYIKAWKMGCKGLTIYRAGSREGIIKTSKKPFITNDPSVDPKTLRPEALIGVTVKVQSGCGKLWITINPYKGIVWEIFASTGSDGGCTSNIQEISRLCSLNLREGVPIERVIDQLRSVKCALAIANPNCKVKSCSDAIASKLEEFLKIYDPVVWDAMLKSILNKSDKPIPKVDFETIKAEFDKAGGCRSGNCS